MLVLPQALTYDQSRLALRTLLQALRDQNEPEVLVDASSLARFDSSALAVLLACRRESLKLGKGFAIRGLSPRLTDLATLYGVQDLLAALPELQPPAL